MASFVSDEDEDKLYLLVPPFLTKPFKTWNARTDKPFSNNMMSLENGPISLFRGAI